MSAWLNSSEISELFAEEIAGAGGKVTDTFADGDRLFIRGVLPELRDVAPRDRLKGGVALCATDTDIFVHPYVFRMVCTNGAIMARAVETRRIHRGDFVVDIESDVRLAIRCCSEREAFASSANLMRSARHTDVDMAIMYAAWMGSHRGPMWKPMLAEIMRRYDAAADRSTFGMMNAVTSVARDQRDPETKWRLEEFGGAVPTMARKGDPDSSPARAARRVLVEVG